MLFIAWYGLVRKFVTFVRRSKSLNTFLSMIVYRNTKSGFVNDVRSNSIASIIENEFAAHNISHNNDSEYRSWANSLQYLRNVIDVSAHLQSSVFKLSKDLIDSIHEEGIVAYTS